MQIPAQPDLCFHLVSSLKPAVQGLMWHFCQHTAILQASQQQIKIPFVDQVHVEDTFYRLHSLSMLLMLYCLLCFPHSQEGIKSHAQLVLSKGNADEGP